MIPARTVAGKSQQARLGESECANRVALLCLLPQAQDRRVTHGAWADLASRAPIVLPAR